MPETNINMDEHWEEVQSEIASRGFVAYPDYISSSERTAFWPQEEGIIKFLDLALKFERKVVYIYSSDFTSEDALDFLLLSAPDDLVDFNIETVRDCLRSLKVDNTQEAKDYLKTAKFYEGHRDLIRVDWVYDDIIHTYRVRPGWYVELIELAGRITKISESLAYE
ncbi:hypothetical protein ACFLY4_09970 [Chloroflexota bacterium]